MASSSVQSGVERILVLGAGVNQVPLIEAALARGLHVTAVSRRTSDPGLAMADVGWVVDTTDHAALVDRARIAKIGAVATAGTDSSVPSLGYLCEALGLPGPTVRAARVASDKRLMKKAFQSSGVASADFRLVRDLAAAEAAWAEFDGEVVVKAPTSSGSRGTTIVVDGGDLAAAVASAFTFAQEGSILVERRLIGPELGAQVVVVDGDCVALHIHDDQITPPPISTPIGHSMPTTLSLDVRQQCRDVSIAAVKAIGITDAVCNVDLVLTPDGPKVLEVGARSGGTGLPELVKASAGHDLYEVILTLALGDAMRLEPSTNVPAAGRLVTSDRDGELIRYDVPARWRDDSRVLRIALDHHEGAAVRRFQIGPDRCGDVLVTDSSPEEAAALAREVAESIRVVTNRV